MKKIALTFILLITMGQSYGHEDKFLIEEVASFDQPWSMAFLPDGNFLVTEKPGKNVFDESGWRKHLLKSVECQKLLMEVKVDLVT